MKIEYFEEEGELWFSCEENFYMPTRAHKEFRRVYRSSGKIPKKILDQGEGVIKEYAKKKVRVAIEKQKVEAKKHEKFAENPDFPVSVEYEGKTLKGIIFSAQDNNLRVRLEEPDQGEHLTTFNVGFIFNGLASFSKSAIREAQKLLIRIYEEKKHYKQHKEVIDLAERLNKS